MISNRNWIQLILHLRQIVVLGDDDFIPEPSGGTLTFPPSEIRLQVKELVMPADFSFHYYRLTWVADYKPIEMPSHRQFFSCRYDDTIDVCVWDEERLGPDSNDDEAYALVRATIDWPTPNFRVHWNPPKNPYLLR
jgi:hypothetical protein